MIFLSFIFNVLKNETALILPSVTSQEMFNEFGLEIKAKSPCTNTIVTGLTNDRRAYFPTAVSFTQGPEGFTPYITGYETTPGSTRYDVGSGEKLAASAIAQLEKLFE